MATTFYDQIGANRRNSVLLALAVVLVPEAALLGAGLAVTVGLMASLISYYAGDALVLTVSGAKEVTQQDQPQLLDVIREIALAAGVPMPRVYLIDDTAPNAFATGRDPAHASIAVTTGLLEKLDREELQGVIGHELSHVRNYDIRYSLLVGVLVGTVALLADFFLRFTFWGGFGGGRRSSNDRDGGGGLQVIVFVLALVLAIVAPFFARLVQLAVRRQ